MKRWLSIALILALLFACTLSPALAEESEAVSGDVDAEVAPAEAAGDTGLTVEGFETPETPAEASEPEQAEEAAPTPEPDATAEADDEIAEVSGTAEGAAILAPEALPGEDGQAAQAVEPAPIAEAAVEAPATAEVAAAATGIRLSADAIAIGLKEGYTGLSVVAEPAGSDLPAVTWRTSNKKIVKVDAATGKITGVKRGSATITAATQSGLEASCKVTVKYAPKKITLKSKTLKLSAGGMTAQLSPTLSGKYASARLTYSSSNASVVTVDSSGLITTVGAGSATVTVKTYNGKKAKCKVKVAALPAAVAFPAATFAVATGQTLALNASALAANGSATSSTLTYAVAADSANPDCIALNPATGEITGVQRGQASVVVTTHNGLSAGCTVTVTAAPASIQLNATAVTVGVKEVYTDLLPEFTAPAGEADCATTVTWSSSNKKVAKVNAATGAITGVKKGSCTITAKTVNGLTAKCKVKVVKAPGKISLSPASASLTVGETGDYKVKYPKGTGGTVTFASADPAIATVDAYTGTVTAVAAGTVTIVATAFNGKKAKAKLTVKAPSVSLPTDDYDTVQSSTSEYNAGMSNAEKLEYVIYVAQSKLNKPYVYGSFGPDSFDCSGFTTYCFRQIGVELKHSAYTQGYDNSQQKIENMADLRRGDIVCFNTNSSDSDLSDHTGIYLGNGKFIHASSSAQKVIVSSMSAAGSYYNRTFSWGRRVLN